MMLRFRGGFQPTQSFPAATPLPTTDQIDGPLCPYCAANVFTERNIYRMSSLSDVQATKSEKGTAIITYTRSGSDLYHSTAVGCRWCTQISSSVLTTTHLNYWTAHWEGSQSDDLSEKGSSTKGAHAGAAFEGNEITEGDGDAQSVGKSSSASGGEELGFFSLESIDFPSLILDISVSFVSPLEVSTASTLDMSMGLVSILVETKVVVEDANTDDQRTCAIPEMKGDESVELCFEALKSPLEDARIGYEGAEGYIENARGWLANCKKNHERCSRNGRSQDGSGFHLPYRLIQIYPDPAEGSKIRDSVSLPEQTPYLALSYVWGYGQDYVLTRASMADMQKSLEETQLPQTILDAISITRSLGYSYLWVDALCIIQDSDEDKMVQLPTMGDVYRNAEVTIIAARAKSAREGFLKQKFDHVKYMVEPFEITPGGMSKDGGSASTTKTTKLRLGYRKPYRSIDDPVNSRAWTLQERVLSTRALVFAHDGPKWTCVQEQIIPSAPSTPEGPPFSTDLVVLDLEKELKDVDDSEDLESTQSEAGPGIPRLREVWLDLRSEYASRNLSFFADKLPAIRGIAARIQQATGWTYLETSGLWEEFLWLDLHWRRDPASKTPWAEGGEMSNPLHPRPEVEVKPSGYTEPPTWSWASVAGRVQEVESDEEARRPIGFQVLRLAELRNAADGTVRPMMVVQGRVVELVWEEARDDDQLCDGFLRELSGDVRYVEGRDAGAPREELGRDGDDGGGEDDNGISDGVRSYMVGEVTLDASDEGIATGCKVWCLAMGILTGRRGPRSPIQGLVLTLAAEEERRDTGQFSDSLLDYNGQLFCRCGFFEMSHPGVFDGVESRPVAIL